MVRPCYARNDLLNYKCSKLEPSEERVGDSTVYEHTVVAVLQRSKHNG